MQSLELHRGRSVGIGNVQLHSYLPIIRPSISTDVQPSTLVISFLGTKGRMQPVRQTLNFSPWLMRPMVPWHRASSTSISRPCATEPPCSFQTRASVAMSLLMPPQNSLPRATLPTASSSPGPTPTCALKSVTGFSMSGRSGTSQETTFCSLPPISSQLSSLSLGIQPHVSSR